MRTPSEQYQPYTHWRTHTLVRQYCTHDEESHYRGTLKTDPCIHARPLFIELTIHSCFHPISRARLELMSPNLACKLIQRQVSDAIFRPKGQRSKFHGSGVFECL